MCIRDSQCFSSRVGGRAQHTHGEFPVNPVPVEKVLRVEEHAKVVGAQERNRICGHRERFVERRPECVGDMHLGRLRDDAHRTCACLHEIAEHLVVLGAHSWSSGGPERDEGRGRQAKLDRCPGEELLVLRVGAGPATFYVRDTEVIELFGDAQLVVHCEGEPLLLRAVPELSLIHI